MKAWRDIDSERPEFGFKIWATGLEVHIGRALFRVRWKSG